MKERVIFSYIHEYSALRDIHTHRPMTTTNWKGRRSGKVVELNLNTNRRKYKSGHVSFIASVLYIVYRYWYLNLKRNHK